MDKKLLKEFLKEKELLLLEGELTLEWFKSKEFDANIIESQEKSISELKDFIEFVKKI